MTKIYRSPFRFIFLLFPHFPFDLVGWLCRSHRDKRHILWFRVSMAKSADVQSETHVWVNEWVRACVFGICDNILHCNDYAKNYFEDWKLTRQHFTCCWYLVVDRRKRNENKHISTSFVCNVEKWNVQKSVLFSMPRIMLLNWTSSSINEARILCFFHFGIKGMKILGESTCKIQYNTKSIVCTQISLKIGDLFLCKSNNRDEISVSNKKIEFNCEFSNQTWGLVFFPFT